MPSDRAGHGVVVWAQYVVLDLAPHDEIIFGLHPYSATVVSVFGRHFGQVLLQLIEELNQFHCFAA